MDTLQYSWGYSNGKTIRALRTPNANVHVPVPNRRKEAASLFRLEYLVNHVDLDIGYLLKLRLHDQNGTHFLSYLFSTWSECLEILKPIKMQLRAWFFLYSCILISTNSGRFGHFLKMGDARYWKSFGSTLYSIAMAERVVIQILRRAIRPRACFLPHMRQYPVGLACLFCCSSS
jgi:hypothetical protein